MSDQSNDITKTESNQLLYEQTNKIFRQDCHFIKSVFTLEALPPISLPEIAFAGRSNVGKSSLINAVVFKKGLANASKTPGRTQSLNFYNLADQVYIVDLPGYGYAKAPKQMVLNWTQLVINYLKGRPNLKRVFLLIDSRHGLKPNDLEIMKLLDVCAVSYQLVLTKTDKISVNQCQHVIELTTVKMSEFTAAYPVLLVTSSEKKQGIESLRAAAASTFTDTLHF